MTKKLSTAPSGRATRKRAGIPQADAGRYYYKGNRFKQMRAFVTTVKLGTLIAAAGASTSPMRARRCTSWHGRWWKAGKTWIASSRPR